MQVSEMMSSARDAMTVKRVFGEPIEKDGVTIIPVARIAGGGGGGSGDSHEGSGSGGGYGVMAKPAGVYVVREGEVSWQPALDVNKIVMGGQIVAVVFFLVIASIFRTRAKSSRHD